MGIECFPGKTKRQTVLRVFLWHQILIAESVPVDCARIILVYHFILALWEPMMRRRLRDQLIKMCWMPSGGPYYVFLLERVDAQRVVHSLTVYNLLSILHRPALLSVERAVQASVEKDSKQRDVVRIWFGERLLYWRQYENPRSDIEPRLYSRVNYDCWQIFLRQ
jgi:hypothetical protein